MAEQQFSAYMVALAFDGGPLVSSAAIAGSPEAAAATLAVQVVQESRTMAPLTGVVVTRLTPEFLRTALRAAEGTLTVDGSNIVSLASTNKRAAALLDGDSDPTPPPAG